MASVANGFGPDPLDSSAFSGNVDGVITQIGVLAAGVSSARVVSVGHIRDLSVLVRSWTVTGSGLRREADKTTQLRMTEFTELAESPQPVVERVERGLIRLTVALRTIDRIVGYVAVDIDEPPTEAVSEEMNRLRSRASMALEHATLRNSSRSTLQETVSVLAALIEGRDAYTERHCINLAEMSLAVGLRMGVTGERLDRLTYGGLLHDIGKIAIPDAILNKPGALTDREFEEMKTHAAFGEEILSRIKSLADVGPIVGQHHERFDGAGYPKGLRSEQIVFEARILSVVDAFDAMTTARPYRPAMPWDRAVAEISSGAQKQFDPEVVEVFLRYIEGEEAQWRTVSPI